MKKLWPTAKPDDPQAARDYAMWLLSSRPFTASDLSSRMIRKGYNPELVEEIISRYTDVGMIDDALFAKMWVESRHRSKGLSKRALKSELIRKGVDKEEIDLALETVTEDSEHEAALALARKKYRSVARLEPQIATRRLLGMLARKGYGGGVAYSVVKEVIAEAADELDAANHAADNIDDDNTMDNIHSS